MLITVNEVSNIFYQGCVCVYTHTHTHTHTQNISLNILIKKLSYNLVHNNHFFSYTGGAFGLVACQ